MRTPPTNSQTIAFCFTRPCVAEATRTNPLCSRMRKIFASSAPVGATPMRARISPVLAGPSSNAPRMPARITFVRAVRCARPGPCRPRRRHASGSRSFGFSDGAGSGRPHVGQLETLTRVRASCIYNQPLRRLRTVFVGSTGQGMVVSKGLKGPRGDNWGSFAVWA